MPESFEAPDPSRLFREARGLIEFPRLFFRFPELVWQPRGAGQPVLILPGYGGGDGTTAALKIYLKFLGYRARGWGLGRNRGSAADLMPRVLKRVSSLAHRSEQKVHLIGWSFGGYLARELARERADLIGQVITMGTPVIGGPKYTVVARRFHRRGIDLEAMAAEIEMRNRVAITIPVIALYSRRDAVVAWQACIDANAPNVEHIEVRTTHFGFGFSPEVYKIIAQRLAANRTSAPGCNVSSGVGGGGARLGEPSAD